MRALGRTVLVTIETANPLGSFKGRGADFLVRSLPAGSTVVCASSGNFGVALAYAARSREWAFTCTFLLASTRPGERGWKPGRHRERGRR
jgi:threonine dehydratase